MWYDRKHFNRYENETYVLRWFGYVERIGNERIAKPVYKGRVNKEE
jgi:hypothetical protein